MISSPLAMTPDPCDKPLTVPSSTVSVSVIVKLTWLPGDDTAVSPPRLTLPGLDGAGVAVAASESRPSEWTSGAEGWAVAVVVRTKVRVGRRVSILINAGLTLVVD